MTSEAFEINPSGVLSVLSDVASLTGSAGSVTQGVESLVLDALSFSEIGSSVCTANDSLHSALINGLSRAVGLVDTLAGNVGTALDGYRQLDGQLADSFASLSGQSAPAGGVPDAAPTPPPTDPVAIPVARVGYDEAGEWDAGEAACRGYISDALDGMGITDPTARDNWTRGMLTIASRESAYNSARYQINDWDTNAHGAIQADGGHLHSSRGGWQTTPDTFARYHQPGTSTDIYDPVANASASMNYIMDRYGVARDGSDLAARVQQADPGRHPRGY